MRKKKKEEQKITIFFGNTDSQEMLITSWKLDGGYLILKREEETRAISTAQITEFMVQDIEEE